VYLLLHVTFNPLTSKDIANSVSKFGGYFVYSCSVNCYGLLCFRTLECQAFIQEPECTPSTS